MQTQKLTLSRNSKTGRSVNVHSCNPTALCHLLCYRFRRSKAQALETERKYGFNPGANNGPITWPVQQATYRRNEAAIKGAAATGQLEEMAVRLVQQMNEREEDLRWCGTGDLFPELVELIALYAHFGRRHSFGFSRKPEMLEYLAECLNALDVYDERRPFFSVSVDESTTPLDIDRLYRAVIRVNQRPTGLTHDGERMYSCHSSFALATWRIGADLEEYLQGQWWRDHVRVIFGIHATQKKTRTGHALGCPATEGNGVTCVECRRCYGEPT